MFRRYYDRYDRHIDARVGDMAPVSTELHASHFVPETRTDAHGSSSFVGAGARLANDSTSRHIGIMIGWVVAFGGLVGLVGRCVLAVAP